MPIGSPPGTLVASADASATTIRAISYGPEELDELGDTQRIDVRELAGLRLRPGVLWLDVVGLSDTEVIQEIGRQFHLHDLALEDVLNVVQRPKLDDYEDHLYVVTRISTASSELDSEQISLFVGPNFVLTFQERNGDCFEPVRDRLRRSRGRIRSAGADYLAYALLDAVLDHYFPIVEAYGERIEQIEEDILTQSGDSGVTALLDVRRELVTLRRVIHGLRDTVVGLLKEDVPVVTEETRVYLRDGHDHAVRLLDDVDSWRELSASLMEVHLAVAGQQLNSVMKVLTIIATIFIPLGFIAGLYGMNFDPNTSALNMPELRWSYGYPFALTIMALVAIGQLVYFRRRGWLGGRRRSQGISPG